MISSCQDRSFQCLFAPRHPDTRGSRCSKSTLLWISLTCSAQCPRSPRTGWLFWLRDELGSFALQLSGTSYTETSCVDLPLNERTYALTSGPRHWTSAQPQCWGARKPAPAHPVPIFFARSFAASQTTLKRSLLQTKRFIHVSTIAFSCKGM